MIVAPFDKTPNQVTREFEREFETNKKDCVVLIVRAAGDSEKWTVAGFSDDGEFRTVVVDDSSDDLLEELKKEALDKSRIVELTTSRLGRTQAREVSTQHGLDLPEEALRQWRKFVRSARERVAKA